MANSGEDFSQIDISKEEKDKLVAEVIRYVLFKTHQNSGCPIKRDELTQLITKNYRQRALPSLIIKEAIEKLSKIFGFEMRELQRSRSSSTNQGRSSQQSVTDAKSYVIISELSADVYRKYVEDTETSHMTGFTFVVISIVYLAGGKIPEETLWHHLRRLGLSETDESHPFLGNLKQALEAIVQQRYLQKNKVNGPQGNTLFYELAERALDQSVSGRMKEYISQVCRSADIASRVDSQLKLVIRPMYSNPPIHGASIVATILKDRDMYNEWTVELKAMADLYFWTLLYLMRLQYQMEY